MISVKYWAVFCNFLQEIFVFFQRCKIWLFLVNHLQENIDFFQAVQYETFSVILSQENFDSEQSTKARRNIKNRAAPAGQLRFQLGEGTAGGGTALRVWLPE